MSFSLHRITILLATLFFSTLITSTPIPPGSTYLPTYAIVQDPTNPTVFTVGTGSSALTVTVNNNATGKLTFSSINATLTSFEKSFKGFQPLATLGIPYNLTLDGQSVGILPFFAAGLDNPTPAETAAEISFEDVIYVLEGVRTWLRNTYINNVAKANLALELDFVVSRAATSAGTTLLVEGTDVATGFIRDAINGTTVLNATAQAVSGMVCSL